MIEVLTKKMMISCYYECIVLALSVNFEFQLIKLSKGRYLFWLKLTYFI